MSFLLSAFAAIVVQKNTRDSQMYDRLNGETIQKTIE
jgi:hypothetical protein